MQFLRVFIPANARLSDGSRFTPPPRHLSCRNDYLYLAAGRHRMKLLANTQRVSRGDRQEIIAASGKKLMRTFTEDGTVVDLIVPPELLGIVRRATLRPRVGVALTFQPRRIGNYRLTGEEFTGAALSTGRGVDHAARFELIEL